MKDSLLVGTELKSVRVNDNWVSGNDSVVDDSVVLDKPPPLSMGFFIGRRGELQGLVQEYIPL